MVWNKVKFISHDKEQYWTLVYTDRERDIPILVGCSIIGKLMLLFDIISYSWEEIDNIHNLT